MQIIYKGLHMVYSTKKGYVKPQSVIPFFVLYSQHHCERIVQQISMSFQTYT